MRLYLSTILSPVNFQKTKLGLETEQQESEKNLYLETVLAIHCPLNVH